MSKTRPIDETTTGAASSPPAPRRRPRPVCFRQGEEITLNQVVITREEFEEILEDVEWAFEGVTSDPEESIAEGARRRLARIRKFFGFLTSGLEG